MIEDPDFRGIAEGRIPWNRDEFLAVLEHRAKLEDTPHDDWSRKPRGVKLVLDEQPVELRFNPDAVDNQIGLFMADMFRALPMDEKQSHMFRYFEIGRFITEHRGELKRDGLIRTEFGTEGFEVSDVLFDVLCEVPYEATSTDNQGRETHSFDYANVIIEAKRRIAEEDS